MAIKTEVVTNFDAIGDMVGAFKGIQTGLDEEEYIEGLIRQSHGLAANAFDMAAAATARTGRIQHVYEFGVAGITKGAPKYGDPTAPNARLWVHELRGHGGNMEIAYSFRPAVNPNPPPTQANTGVDSEYLATMGGRKYVFWNKAFVMETGRSVEISPKAGKFLFVPFYGEESDNEYNGRGYMMWNAKALGPIVTTPGRQTKGQFTALWIDWWAGAGSHMMQEEMEKNILMDIDTAVEELSKRANDVEMRPAQATNIPGAASAAKAFFTRLFGIKTSKRMETRVR